MIKRERIIMYSMLKRAKQRFLFKIIDRFFYFIIKNDQKGGNFPCGFGVGFPYFIGEGLKMLFSLLF